MQRACTVINPPVSPQTENPKPDVLLVIADDVKNIEVNNFGIFNAEKEASILRKFKNIIERDLKASMETKAKLLRFISYGSSATVLLGEGERAGVLNSYFQAFKKMPSTVSEWSDVLKVSQGRWPSERNKTAEENAQKQFKKIYGRNPASGSSVDENAVMVMAYGLLPAQRNTKSEQAALIAYKWVYGKIPSAALDWNIVRAIAYSGAKR
jgi:hypothetical protein